MQTYKLVIAVPRSGSASEACLCPTAASQGRDQCTEKCVRKELSMKCEMQRGPSKVTKYQPERGYKERHQDGEAGPVEAGWPVLTWDSPKILTSLKFHFGKFYA